MLLLSPFQDPRWRIVWRLALVALLIVISWLAFSPHPPPAADLGWDKANHFAAFATLALVGLQSLRRSSRIRGPVMTVAAVLLGLLAYGILIELVQSQIPGRDADWHDVVADMLGALIGVALHGLALVALRGWRGVRARSAAR